MPKATTRYIALLRGINVGGSTMIKMQELRTMFEALGFDNVKSYINSGNLAFDVHGLTESKIAGMIEAALRSALDKDLPVMVREQRQITAILKNNPFEGRFASHKEMHVLFLKAKLSKAQIALLPEVTSSGESFAVHGREIYCHLPMGVANSLLGSGKLEKLLGLPITARNWRTVTKLAEL